MGLLPFQSFFGLAPGYRSRSIKALITAALAGFAVCGSAGGALPVVAVDLRIERCSILEHAVDDPKDLVHARADGSHPGFALFQMALVDLPDQRIGADGRHGHHEQDPSRLLAALLTHFKAAAAVSADFKGRMQAEERSQLFDAGKAFDALVHENLEIFYPVCSAARSLITAVFTVDFQYTRA